VRALVTGAAGGIGRAVVAELAATGAQVGACDLEIALARDTPEGAAATAAFDVRDEAGVRAGVEAIVEQLGGLDAVVANAGVVDTIHRADRFPSDAWRADIDANLTGQFLLAQAAWPALLASAKHGGGPSLVFVSSASAETGLPGQVAYTAAKAGITGMARTLAAEWGPHGVRVNVVMPGLIATPKVRALPEALRDAMARQIPLGRVGEPVEVAGTIAFLLSRAAGYVHGQVLRIDGGYGLAVQALATGDDDRAA
jgi:NAD(P)-dependent dehydrogenase (short-subunit alcohol dehydrogenase family)